MIYQTNGKRTSKKKKKIQGKYICLVVAILFSKHGENGNKLIFMVKNSLIKTFDHLKNDYFDRKVYQLTLGYFLLWKVLKPMINALLQPSFPNWTCLRLPVWNAPRPTRARLYAMKPTWKRPIAMSFRSINHHIGIWGKGYIYLYTYLPQGLYALDVI